jgi:hypothetical protein
VFVGYLDLQKGYKCYDPHTKKLHVTMDVFFHESEPYYSKGLPTTTFQGENFSQGNVLPEGGNDDGNNEFFELEEITERLSNSSTLEELLGGTYDVSELEAVIEMLGRNHSHEESPINIELPLLTPLPDESTQNVEPQVLLNPISNESTVIFDKTLVPLKSLVPTYSQRSNEGIPKKQYEPDLSVTVKYPINNYVSTHRLSESYALTLNQLSNVSIPSSMQEALTEPNWAMTINEEMKALQRNSTWELVSLPEGKRTISC